MISLFTLLLSLSCAQAQEASFSPATSVWGISSQRRVVEGRFNPRNQALRVPEQILSTEVRPDWRASYSSLSFTFRPRLVLSRERTEVTGLVTQNTDAFLRWGEAFLNWDALESVSLAYGLQNVQWGPAESGSPSNRIFRDTVQVKDSIYSVKGKHLAKATWAPSSSFSEVAVVELSDNGDGEPEPFESHSKKALLKSELSWAGGAEYGGLVLGWRDRNGLWLGEYFNLEPLDGFSLYADLSHTQGSLAHYPVSRGAYSVFAQNRKHDSRIYTFSVTGARYAFENGNDWRFEWIYQEAGYGEGERNLARGALFFTGLDFPGRNYLFSSIRFPNAFSVRDWTVYCRALYSLGDTSSALFASSENALSDHGTLIASLGAGVGQEGSELRGAVDLAGTLAYRHAW